MCGIIGIISKKKVIEETLQSLISLNHRGIQSSGIISQNTKKNKFSSPIKILGKNQEEFHKLINPSNEDNIAIAHNRYVTSGDNNLNNAQPMIIQKPGIALAFNGQISNYLEIKKQLEKEEGYTFFSESDTETLLLNIAKNLEKKRPQDSKNINSFVNERLFPALEKILEEVKGAYSAVAIIDNKGLLAFKDPHGIRPLCYAIKKDSSSIMFSSETTTFNFLGNYQRPIEIEQGQAIFIDKDLNIYQKSILKKEKRFCPFETVYFAQIDSKFNNQEVYQSRYNLGIALAKHFIKLKEKIDIVIPIPKSPIPSAQAIADYWKKPFGGIIARPSHSIIRAFQQEKNQRDKLIEEKFFFIKSLIKEKRIALVDDSIIRGETSKKIISKLYNLKAKEIHFFSTYPPCISICPYGIDIASYKELLIKNNTPEDLENARKSINATTLNYLPIDLMLEAINQNKKESCLGCTEKKYSININSYHNFSHLREIQRNN